METNGNLLNLLYFICFLHHAFQTSEIYLHVKKLKFENHYLPSICLSVIMILSTIPIVTMV